MLFQQFGFLEILIIAAFIVLVLGFIVLFRLAGVLKQANAGKTPATKPAELAAGKPKAAAAKPAPAATMAAPQKAADDKALVAILAAAVAAYMDVSPNSLYIKSYRRLKSGKPSWSKAGRRDIMSNHI